MEYRNNIKYVVSNYPQFQFMEGCWNGQGSQYDG